MLSWDFGISVDVRECSVNVTEPAGVGEKPKKLILVGASNLHRVTNNLQLLGWEVVYLCLPGWVATPSNVDEAIEKL